MIPISFKETNTVIRKGGPGIMDLYAWSDKKQTVSCWQPTWKECLLILFHRKIWISMSTQYWVKLEITLYFKDWHDES